MEDLLKKVILTIILAIAVFIIAIVTQFYIAIGLGVIAIGAIILVYAGSNNSQEGVFYGFVWVVIGFVILFGGNMAYSQLQELGIIDKIKSA